MHQHALSLLCALATPGLVAMAQPCTSPPPAPNYVSFIEPIACYPQLTWRAAAGAEQYIVYRSLTCHIDDAQLVGTTTGLRFDDQEFPTSLHGQYMCYFVRGVNACGQGPAARSDRDRVDASPRIWSNTATSECNQVTLRWSPLAASPGVSVTYSVWRTPEFGGVPVRIAENLTTPVFVDINPPRGWFRYAVSTRTPVCEGPSVSFGDAAGNPLTIPRLNAYGYYGCGTVQLYIAHGACTTDYTIFRMSNDGSNDIVEIARTRENIYYDHVPDRSRSYYYAAVAHTPFGDTERSPWEWAWVTENPPWLEPIDQSYEFSACSEGGAQLTAPLYYTHDLMTIQWYKDGQPLTDGGNLWGAQSLDLIIRPASELDNGAYTVAVTNDCGTALSDPFNVRYAQCSICPWCAADFNQDGGVDGGDVQAFMEAWEAAEYCSDVNYDGGTDGQDMSDWFRWWEGGSC